MAVLTEEQNLLKEQVSAWVSEECPVRKFRDMRDSGNELGFDGAVWQTMVDMGWTGILVPEAYGGSGLDCLAFGVVMEEHGRQLVASPLFASALVGVSALLAGGTEAQKQALLPAVVDGSQILTLAVDEGPRHAPAEISLEAERTDDGYRLSGRKTFVIEGMAASTVVVAARTRGNPGSLDGVTLFLVPADTIGLTRERLATMDSRGYANLTFDRVEVSRDAVLGEVDGGGPLLDSVLDRARAVLSAEMLGAATQAFDLTLDYLKTRKQFGRIIGSFQALGHRAAGLYTRLELTRSCVEAALGGLDAGQEDVAELCSLSKAQVGGFLQQATNEMIQMHGGIGVTDEFDAGLYLKRARVQEALYGNQAYHRDRYGRLLGF